MLTADITSNAKRRALTEGALDFLTKPFDATEVFDALTSERPYKQAWPLAEAIEEIKRQSGRQFDPCVVEGFLNVVGH